LQLELLLIWWQQLDGSQKLDTFAMVVIYEVWREMIY